MISSRLLLTSLRNQCRLQIRRIHINDKLIVRQIVDKYVPNHGERTKINLLREEVLAAGSDRGQIHDKNVDYLILNSCVHDDNKRQLALAYTKVLKEKGHELNLASISILLQIYGTLNEINNKFDEEIFELYDNLRSKYDILDINLTESSIIALSTTSRWQECFDLLQKLRLVSEATTQTHEAIIIALFKNNYEERAWVAMQEMVDLEKRASNRVFKVFISLIQESNADLKTCLAKCERLFEFWNNNDILIPMHIANSLIELFKKYGKTLQLSTINVKGDCSKCKRRLPESTISGSDYKRLKKAFFDRVIVGKDVFRKTTPQELQRFQRFVAQRQKFDVIVDGLNVAFSAGTGKAQEHNARMLISVVQHYARQGKSVLVLGRNHMRRWPKIDIVNQSATLFLAQNLSQDDPYLLYCALNSGQGTIIVSRDLMRGHLYLLKDPQLKQLFKRWLSISQHKLITVKKNGSAVIEAPPSYIQSAQKLENERIWHLPCENIEKDVLALAAPQRKFAKTDPVLWLCVQL